MRSSPSRPDPLDPGPLGFAHRGLHTPGIRENTLAAFDAAVRLGAGIELDVLFSVEGVPIVLHDRDLRRFGSLDHDDAGEPLSVAQCARILPDGYPIAPTLSDALAQVNGQVPVLVEVKAPMGTASRPGRCARRTYDIVRSYDGPVGVMSFHPLVAFWLRRHAPHIRRGLVVPAGLRAVDRWWRLAWARPDFVAVEVAALHHPWVRALRDRMPVYSWTVNSPDARARVESFADAAIWEGDGRP